MKKRGLLVLSLIVIFLLASIISAQTPSADKVKALGSSLQDKAESMNPFLGTVSYLLFGTQLEWGWTFAVAITFWIILFILLLSTIKSFIHINVIFVVLMDFVIVSLAMHAFSDNFVTWIDAISKTWISAGLAIVTSIIIGVIVMLILRYTGRGANLEEAEEQGAIIRTAAQVEKDKFKEMEKDK